MKNRTISIIATLALLLAGCTQPKEDPTPTVDPIIRPDLTAEFVGRIDGSTATIPLTTAALKWLRGTDDGLLHNKTDQAYDNLIKGTKDIIFVTAPSDDELAAAKSAGVEMEVIPIVKDALVFLANTANPVSSLSQKQVKDIYTGVTKNWKDIGGKDTDIIPYQRPVNSGSQTLFLQLAMGSATPMEAPKEYQIVGMGDLVDAISEYDNAEDALGYSVYYYADQMYTKDNVKLLGIDGVQPTNESISNDSYPYGTHYFAVIRSTEPVDSTARQLIDWFLSSEGQQVSSGARYVPLDPSNIVPPNDSNYGYLGSTPQNTTQSSGTGGPRSFVPQDLALECSWDNSDCWNSDGTIRLPGYPEAQTTAQAWIDAQPALPEPDPNSSSELTWWVHTYRDLVIVSHGILERAPLGITWMSRDSIIIRVTDGKKLILSDLFYDGVNYIEFINKNLLVPGVNQSLDRCTNCGVVDPMTVFTGLPSTFEGFSIMLNNDNELPPFGLEFSFPVGNPFVKKGQNSPDVPYITLNLPADLSPYGVYWRVDSVKTGSTVVEHLVRDYTGNNPKDVAFNNSIDAFAADNPGWDYIAIMSITDPQVFVAAYKKDGTDTILGPAVFFDYTTGELLS